MLQNFINELVMMWVLIDPIGTIPVFLMVTARMPAAMRPSIAVRASVIASLILVFFMLGGRILLNALGISLESFQVAGGIILFLFALTMVFGPSKPEQEKEETETLEHSRSVAVFPLAIPSIAGPGPMLGAVLLVDSSHFDLIDTGENFLVLFIVLGINLAFMLSAGPILRVIGESGVNVISRIMGLILAAVAADTILMAIATFFHIPGITSTGLL
jgi:multiple antibiotic resistance protein